MKDFASRMRKRAKELEDGVANTVRNTALSVLMELDRTTPVDTGLAVANWVTSINAPSREVVTQETDPVSSGLAVIKTRKARQDIWISNNLLYIRTLNNGHSQQAPAGFVEDAVRAGGRYLSRAKVFE